LYVPYHGYKVKVYYIHQVPEIAWQFTKDRERVEHRSIEIEGFKESYHKIKENLMKLCEMTENITISIVIKDEKNRVGRLIENVNEDIFNQLPAFLTQEQLNAVILG